MFLWKVIYFKKELLFRTPNLKDDKKNTCNNIWIKSIYNEYYHTPSI